MFLKHFFKQILGMKIMIESAKRMLNKPLRGEVKNTWFILVHSN